MNFVVEKTIGKVFTAGSSIDDLTKEMEMLAQKNIYSVADLSIEDVGNASKEVRISFIFSIWMQTKIKVLIL